MGNAAEQFANLPPDLATRHADLLAALVNDADPDPNEGWPGEDYLKAYAPEAVAKILIGVLHPHLRLHAIRYLWRKDLARRDRVILAKASLASGKVRYFGKCTYVVEVNWTAWLTLSERERVALMDHELSHFALDSEKQTPVLRAHDVEEFGEIVGRWGLWKPDLASFGAIVRDAAQISLFEPDPAGAPSA